MPARSYRGSRKHILDWVSTPTFSADLVAMLRPVSVVLAATPAFMPKGIEAPLEARLDSLRTPFESLKSLRERLRNWWLAYPERANTPNWDLVVECRIEGRPGLILVEAKANCAELSHQGKPTRKPSDGATDSAANGEKRSAANRARIQLAIQEAREGLSKASCECMLSIDKHYQLSNRLAFMWKLSELGIPTVLIYLGFTGDTGITDVGQPFEDDAHWQRFFQETAREIVPQSMVDRRLELPNAPAWLLIRSRRIREPSPSRTAVLGRSSLGLSE